MDSETSTADDVVQPSPTDVTRTTLARLKSPGVMALAAEKIAELLDESRSGHVAFAPGDGTQYAMTVVPCTTHTHHVEWRSEGGSFTWARPLASHQIVFWVGDVGIGYPWDGQYVHPGYAHNWVKPNLRGMPTGEWSALIVSAMFELVIQARQR